MVGKHWFTLNKNGWKLNDDSSLIFDTRDINGLFVANVPPVVKPKQRVEFVEIEGRDGDIVYPLGYSAYEKEVIIGLIGGFDFSRLDEIINALSSYDEMRITFSNEPELFYIGRIVDEIDYNKLKNFRRATIRFHCQPFKYPSVRYTGGVLYSSSVSSNSVTFDIANYGNILSTPVYCIDGKNTIKIKLADMGENIGSHYYDPTFKELLRINIGSTRKKVFVDTRTLDAHLEDGTLVNLSCVGDYENLRLKPGTHKLKVDNGGIYGVTVADTSRWL